MKKIVRLTENGLSRIVKRVIKEEFNNKISREDYLEKVLGYLVDDTIFDYNEEDDTFLFPIIHPTNRYVVLRFSNWHPQRPTTLLALHHDGSDFHPIFSKYCKVNYGLTDEEIDYLLEKYTQIMDDKRDKYDDDWMNMV